MKKLKIAVYAICKNESQFVNRWVESMKEADYIIVTDTGSTDDTVNKLKKNNVKVYEEKIEPWRFDVARNISLSHVPDNVDVCVCTDLDEFFEPGWRSKIEKEWKKNTKMGNYIFNWSLKKDGTPDIQFHYFKIHSRYDYKWNYPVHECLKYVGKEPEVKKFIKGIVLNHDPDRTKSRGSYLNLLELGVKEKPFDDRMRYYLGREYMYSQNWQKCIYTLEEYLKLSTAIWIEERCAAMRWIAKSYSSLKNYEKAYCWYFKAIAECPHMREPYIEFAILAYQLKDWSMILYMTEEALRIKNRSSCYINMGYAWDHTPYDLLAISTYYLDLFKKSADYAKKAVEITPGNERLNQNLKIINDKLSEKSKLANLID